LFLSDTLEAKPASWTAVVLDDCYCGKIEGSKWAVARFSS
jgi:hypothetical protein